MSQLQQVANRLDQVQVRRARFQGRDHFVVPAVMLRPQVLNCNGCDSGGEFVPAEEIAASVPGWAGRPVTIGHPIENGIPVSANAPDVLERYQVGYVFNAAVTEDGALKGEAWIDVQLAKRVLRGNRLLERLKAGEMLEVSTGYFRNAEQKKGIFNGRSYKIIQRDLLPDHFAILLDERGACSIDDGCGAPRVNSAGDSLTKRMRAVEDAVWKRARAVGEDWWPVEIFEDAVIVQAGPQRLVRMPYAINDDGAIEFGEPEEVEVKYKAVSNQDGAGLVQRLARGLARLMGIEAEASDDGGGDGSSPNEPETGQNSGGGEAAINANSGEESNKMDRATTISALAANSAIPFDAAQLEAMTNEQLAALQALVGNSGSQQGSDQQEPAANDGGCGCKGAQKPAANAGAGDIPADAIAKAVKAVIGAELAPIKEFMNAHQASTEQQKTELVSRLAANERCPFTKEELEAFGLATLEKLERSYLPASYLGLGGPRGLGSNADDAPPAPPAVLLAPAANADTQSKEA